MGRPVLRESSSRSRKSETRIISAAPFCSRSNCSSTDKNSAISLQYRFAKEHLREARRAYRSSKAGAAKAGIADAISPTPQKNAPGHEGFCWTQTRYQV